MLEILMKKQELKEQERNGNFCTMSTMQRRRGRKPPSSRWTRSCLTKVLLLKLLELWKNLRLRHKNKKKNRREAKGCSGVWGVWGDISRRRKAGKGRSRTRLRRRTMWSSQVWKELPTLQSNAKPKDKKLPTPKQEPKGARARE
eukprot:g3332.t1